MKAAQDFKTISEYNGYLRKYFAALAMQGLIGQEYTHDGHEQTISETIARRAIRAADELLKQLEQ